jgi:C-terminal processing protease CtpA/Prc
VAVLAGPGCISSTEGFLLMCKALPRVTVVGQPSRGASGNPGPFEVLPGLTVWSSRWQALDTAGACIEGVGVPPDVVVEPAPRGAKDADPVLDRAVELLRE